MKLRTIGLALVATTFMAGQALAQAGTMQPIPNPPEKHKTMHKKKVVKKTTESSDASGKTETKSETKSESKTEMKKK